MGADAHRARFHSSMLDTKMLKAKQKFKELHDDDPIGKLMHDFRCTSSIDMFYDELKNTVKYFKETEGERRLRPFVFLFLIRKWNFTKLQHLY